MRLISFTYRDGRVASNEATGTLDGMGANAPTVMDENSSTGTPGIHITPGTLAPCRPINIYLLDRGLNQLSKNTPPLGTKTQGRDIVSFKGCPQKQQVPTGTKQ